MPEMEKGRPPENKRSRKPAHPVKREINQEMKVRDERFSESDVLGIELLAQTASSYFANCTQISAGNNQTHTVLVFNLSFKQAHRSLK